MDPARRPPGARAAPDRPCTDLGRGGGEEGDEVEEPVGRADEAGERRFAQAERLHESGPVLRVEVGDLRLDGGGQRQAAGPHRGESRGERRRQRLPGPVLAAVQHGEQRTVRQEAVAAERRPVEFRPRHGPERLFAFQRPERPFEGGDLDRLRSLAARPVQPPLDEVEIGEQTFRCEGLEFALRVRRVRKRGIVEVAQDEAERLLIADLLEPARRQALARRAVFARNVAEPHLGVRRPARGEAGAERIDPRIRNPHRAEAHLAAEPDRHAEPRHRVEHRRLPGTREPHESNPHRVPSLPIMFGA